MAPGHALFPRQVGSAPQLKARGAASSAGHCEIRIGAGRHARVRDPRGEPEQPSLSSYSWTLDLRSWSGATRKPPNEVVRRRRNSGDGWNMQPERDVVKEEKQPSRLIFLVHYPLFRRLSRNGPAVALIHLPTRHHVSALQPAAEIEVGAALRAEGPELGLLGLAAKGAAAADVIRWRHRIRNARTQPAAQS